MTTDRKHITVREVEKLMAASPLTGTSPGLTIRKYGDLAGQELPTTLQQLRHVYGFALADQGEDTRFIQDYLRRRDVQHTVVYTETNPGRFESLWR
jgi:type 1 fimbriae regulatory protein FimB